MILVLLHFINSIASVIYKVQRKIKQLILTFILKKIKIFLNWLHANQKITSIAFTISS